MQCFATGYNEVSPPPQRKALDVFKAVSGYADAYDALLATLHTRTEPAVLRDVVGEIADRIDG